MSLCIQETPAYAERGMVSKAQRKPKPLAHVLYPMYFAYVYQASFGDVLMQEEGKVRSGIRITNMLIALTKFRDDVKP